MDISDNTINQEYVSSPTPLYNINLLDQYINALIVNVNSKILPNQMNLIFDSGAINGLLGIGAALYIHRLEEKKYIKINKISGCSIGSLIAVWYIKGCSNQIYDNLNILFSHYKTHKNFYIYETIVKNVIYKLFDTDDMASINDKLYINYYNTKLHKEVIVSNFKNRNHLITSILRSSHIPFITNELHKYDKHYIDGVAPYIFKIDDDKICKNLFIKLIDLHNPVKSLNIQKEENIYTRLLKGVSDTNDFFVNGNTKLCMYTNSVVIVQLYIRKTFVLFVMLLIDYIIIMKNNMPECICECFIYKTFLKICKKYWLYLLDKLA
jgi:hypothetical protein